MLMTKEERLTEIARRGQELFDQRVLPLLKPEDHGKFVVVDIETGDYEIGDDSHPVSRRMCERYPAERLWLMRVGYKAAFKMGVRSTFTFPKSSRRGDSTKSI